MSRSEYKDSPTDIDKNDTHKRLPITIMQYTVTHSMAEVVRVAQLSEISSPGSLQKVSK